MDDRIVHRHGADHGRALGDQLFAEGLGVAVGGQVHDGVRPHADGGHHLLHLHPVVLAVPGDPQVDVDLGPEHGPHALGIQALVIFVGADDRLPLRHQGQKFLDGHALLAGNGLQLLGHDPLSGRFHLRCVRAHVIILRF